MSESIEEKMVSVNQKELSLFATNIIPTSKYFELRFEQVNSKLDQIMERIDIKIDTGLREGRQLTVKLFSLAMIISAIPITKLRLPSTNT